MIQKLHLLLLATFVGLGIFPTSVQAQATKKDTTVHETVEHMPYVLTRTCTPERHPGWNEDSIRRCAETQLLGLLARTIRYPFEAQSQNIQGTVVTSFIVEKNGRMTDYGVVKDIGGGCGTEALRVLAALDSLGMRWNPARIGKDTVRMRMRLPLRFKLQEAPPYVIGNTGDTLYVEYQKAPQFRGGVDSMINYTINQLEYPAAYEDSCKTGIMEMSLIVKANGSIVMDNQIDFSNLGSDFQWEALKLLNGSREMWQPAEYNGKKVSTTTAFRVAFKSDSPKCAAANQQFDRSVILADEGAQLYDTGETEAAIAKWTQALELTPNNTEVLYYRGTALLNLDRKEEACKDFNRVKALLGFTWFEEVRRLVCGW